LFTFYDLKGVVGIERLSEKESVICWSFEALKNPSMSEYHMDLPETRTIQYSIWTTFPAVTEAKRLYGAHMA